MYVRIQLVIDSNFMLEPYSCSVSIIPKIPRKEEETERMFCFLPFQITLAAFLDIYAKACSQAKRRALFSLHTNIHCGCSAGKSLASLSPMIFLSLSSVLEETVAWLHDPSNHSIGCLYCHTQVFIILVPAQPHHSFCPWFLKVTNAFFLDKFRFL